jgi:hypothetical protein
MMVQKNSVTKKKNPIKKITAKNQIKKNMPAK